MLHVAMLRMAAATAGGLLLVSACAAAEPSPRQEPLQASTQMIVVTTPDWNAVDGRLQRYERTEADGPWKPVGGPVAIVVGKNGLGWGTGLVATDGPGVRDAQDPVKHEGDGKSPAGVFRFGTAFGDAERAPTGWTLSYIRLTPTVECVDDSNSRSYNQIVDRATMTPDWNSSEKMLSVGEAYRWGAVIENNASPIVPSAGSCVFMHIWGGRGHGTAGCTAMAQEQLEPILAWLDPGKTPVLVQLPRAQYEKLRKAWRLPHPARP